MRVKILTLILGLFLYQIQAKLLNDKTFNEQLKKSGKWNLVNFYSSKCAHSNALEPLYEFIQELYDGNDEIEINKIEATQNEMTRKQENIIAFPTVRLYNPSGNAVGGIRTKNTIKDFTDFILDNTGVRPEYPQQRSIIVDDLETVKSLHEQGKDLLMVFYSDKVTNWQLVSLRIEKAINYLKDPSKGDYENLEVLRIDGEYPGTDVILKHYNIPGYPNIYFLPHDSEQPSHYPNQVTTKGVVEYLLEQKNRNSTQSIVQSLLAGLKGVKSIFIRSNQDL